MNRKKKNLSKISTVLEIWPEHLIPARGKIPVTESAVIVKEGVSHAPGWCGSASLLAAPDEYQ